METMKIIQINSLFVLLLSILPLRCEDDGVGVDVDDDNNTEE